MNLEELAKLLLLFCSCLVILLPIIGFGYWINSELKKQERARRERRKRIKWIMKYGTEAEKQTLLLQLMNEKLENMSAGIAFHNIDDLFRD